MSSIFCPLGNFQMIDPGGIANWSVTHVDWSEGKWHPKAYQAQDVTYELLKNVTVSPLFCSNYTLCKLIWIGFYWCMSLTFHIYCLQSVDENYHVTSDEKVTLTNLLLLPSICISIRSSLNSIIIIIFCLKLILSSFCIDAHNCRGPRRL